MKRISIEENGLYVVYEINEERELLFSRHSLLDFGLASTQRTMPRRSSQMLSISNTGSWSAKEHLPLAKT